MQTVSLELLSYLKSVNHVIHILLLLSLYRNYLEGEKDIFGGNNVELTRGVASIFCDVRMNRILCERQRREPLEGSGGMLP